MRYTICMDINNCTFTGIVKSRPIYKDVASGLCEFILDISGMKREDAFSLTVNVWGKQASSYADALGIGSKVGVSGTLRFNSFASIWCLSTGAVAVLVQKQPQLSKDDYLEQDAVF